MSYPGIESSSETWRTLSKWLDQQETLGLGAIRSPSCPDDRTQQLRGRLQLIEELQGLGAKHE